MPMRGAPSLFPPIDPLLNTRVDPPTYGWPQLSTLALYNKTRELRRLLKRESPNSIGLDGRTPLHIAALAGDNVEVATLLLAAGANPSATTRRGDTPLQYAERFGRLRLAALLRGAKEPRERRAGSNIVPPPEIPSIVNTSTAPTPTPLRCCIHSCHGRGQCLDGSCACPNGDADDVDCGLVGTAAPPPRANALSHCPHGRRHGIFIGGDGLRISAQKRSNPRARHGGFAPDCARTLVTTLDATMHGVYAPLDAFLLRLLDDPSVRSPSAECAQAVWHPLFGHRLYHNTDEMLKWRLKAALSGERARREASAIAAGGSSSSSELLPPVVHLHEEHQDIGHCGSPMGVYHPGDVILTYWGDLECPPLDASLIVLPGGVRHAPRLSRSDTLWRPIDTELVKVAKRAYAAERIHAPRRLTLFFKGSTREDKVPPEIREACFRLDRKTDDKRCRDGLYSLGIRQAVKLHIGHDPILRFNPNVTREVLEGGEKVSYQAELLRSQFCLSAPGMGFGVRLIDYVAAACIPVVIRPGKLRLPFEPDLDYDEFAVSIPFAEIGTLPKRLREMSEAVLRQKRERLKEVHTLFLWDHAYGKAYETAREHVMRRLNATTRAN